jgi:predicted kinase
METIILCGIQGAGKSTFCRDRYWDSHIRINYDMLRTRYREKLLVAACIEAKQPFVIDATNPTNDDRKRYLAPAKAARFKVVGIEFQIVTGLAIARNAARSGKGHVPEKAIYATAAKFQPLSFDEGFDEIWQAIVTVNGIEIKEKQREI